jgi:IS5 family transposase
VPPRGRYGKFRPKQVLADRAYDSKRHRQQLRERGIRPRIAKRGDHFVRGGTLSNALLLKEHHAVRQHHRCRHKPGVMRRRQR